MLVLTQHSYIQTKPKLDMTHYKTYYTTVKYHKKYFYIQYKRYKISLFPTAYENTKTCNSIGPRTAFSSGPEVLQYVFFSGWSRGNRVWLTFSKSGPTAAQQKGHPPGQQHRATEPHCVSVALSLLSKHAWDLPGIGVVRKETFVGVYGAWASPEMRAVMRLDALSSSLLGQSVRRG